MKFLVICACILSFSATLHAEGYCSLVVRVFVPQGVEERTPIPISVEERDGRKTDKRYEAGGARFCALGLFSVTVTVGSAGCNQTVVRNVPLYWGKTMVVPVIYNSDPCTIDTVSLASCVFLIRFVDSEGTPVPGASLKVEYPERETLEADEFGRVVETTMHSKTLRGTVSASGYSPNDVSLSCTDENPEVEQFVTLKSSR